MLTKFKNEKELAKFANKLLKNMTDKISDILDEKPLKMVNKSNYKAYFHNDAENDILTVIEICGNGKFIDSIGYNTFKIKSGDEAIPVLDLANSLNDFDATTQKRISDKFSIDAIGFFIDPKQRKFSIKINYMKSENCEFTVKDQVVNIADCKFSIVDDTEDKIVETIIDRGFTI